ncbi:MAG: transcriptional regulator [Planctomycetaceae bacterium]|nr:transcriptional regulator [Planctomycetaceae bacterium]
MGRPDLTEVRQKEILDAFEACVAKYGLEGSSLERVAEEAGMKRSILRHYIGNRDDLIEALAKRVVAKYRTHFQEFLENDSETDRVDRLLALFFPTKPLETAESVMVIESLIAASDQHTTVRMLMLEYVDDLVADTALELRAAYPNATKARCWSVAYGLICIWFNQESLAPLQLPGKYLRAARANAKVLVESLEI